MRTGPGVAAFALTAVLQSSAAFAQPHACPTCRAEYAFGHCDGDKLANPPKGAIGVAGTVVAVESMECATGLTVEVRRSWPPKTQPARIRIEVRPCLFWRGQAGDEVGTIVSEAPAEDGAYRAQVCY